MIELAAPIAVVAALGGVTHSLLRAGWMATRSRKASIARRRIRDEEFRELVEKFGESANSFMTLYPGFETFAHPDPSIQGAIAFAETTDTWVGGAEPFCAPEDRVRMLAAFAQAAAALGKTALMLPVDAAHAELARQAGYRAVMIGTEPTWDLERFPRTGRTWADVVPTAKILASKGAQVTAFDPSKIPEQDLATLQKMTDDWLGTRKMEALSFLNQVDPWFSQADKRYFRIDHQGRTLAFLAAIPVWARGGWYLIDLIRRSDSPAGSTELLLLQSMRLLRESGAKVCTMGVAPLSGIENAAQYPASDFAANRGTYRLLHWIYDKGNALYNFKPLHQYKLKFDPSSTPPMFLIYSPKLGVRPLLGMARAFQPGGMARAAGSGAIRMITRFNLADWIRNQLTTHTVVRSVPPSWTRLLERCKLTVTLLVANLALYFANVDSSGRLHADVERGWGFSWQQLLANPLHAVLLSPFLHWNATHLSLNLASLVVFTGGLEYLAGSSITAACYFVPLFFANPATAGVLALLKPWFTAINLSEIDVGASLGIFGTAGGLSHFLRWGGWLLLGLSVSSVLSAIVAQAFMPNNHLVALGLGWLMARLILKD